MSHSLEVSRASACMIAGAYPSFRVVARPLCTHDLMSRDVLVKLFPHPPLFHILIGLRDLHYALLVQAVIRRFLHLQHPLERMPSLSHRALLLVHVGFDRFEVQLFIEEPAIDVGVVHLLGLRLVVHVLGVRVRSHHVHIVNHQLLFRLLVMLENLLDLADLDVVGAVVRVVDADIGIWLGTGGATLEGNLLAILILEGHLLPCGGALHCASALFRFLDVPDGLSDLCWEGADRVFLLIDRILVI